MAAASALIEALAKSLGRTSSSVEAYALSLRRHGWWAESKVGRGARPLTDMDGAKLLLAILGEGPKSLPSFFLEYANMVVLPEQADQPALRALRERLDLPASAKLLDFVEAFVRAFREDTVCDVVFHRSSPPGMLEDHVFDGPGVELRIMGPMPFGQISFLPTDELRDAADQPEVGRAGRHRIVFVHEWYGLHAENSGEDKEAFAAAIAELRAERARGVGFERFIGGREFQAIGEALKD